jgi:hypothetical protein
MNDTTNTTQKSTYELVTQQVREHLIPLNAVLALCITLWAVIDFASPLLGVPGLLLLAGVMGLAAALCFWRLPAEPVVQRLKALGFGLLLSALGLGSAGATLKVKQGGWIASSFGKVRDVQTVLFDLQTQVARVQQGVDQANTTLARIDQRTEAMTEESASCPDFSCLIVTNAPVRRYAAVKASGVDPRTVELNFLYMLAGTSASNNFDAINFLLQEGIPKDINQPFLAPAWYQIFNPSTFDKPPDRMPIVVRTMARQMRVGADRYKEIEDLIGSCALAASGGKLPENARWLDIAALHGNDVLVKQLIAAGANPRLPIPWCVNLRKKAEVPNLPFYATEKKFIELLKRAPDLHLTAQEFLDE